MERVASEMERTSTRFTWSTRNTAYSEMNIKDDQKTTHGHGNDDPDSQDVLTAVNTIETIVSIWRTLKNPGAGVMKNGGGTNG